VHPVLVPAPCIPVRSIHPAHCSRSCRMQSSEGLEKLRTRIEKIERQIEDTEDQAQKTALLLVLAPLLQRENFLQGEQASGCMIQILHDPWPCSLLLLANTLLYSKPPAGMGGGVGGGSGGGEIPSDPGAPAPLNLHAPPCTPVHTSPLTCVPCLAAHLARSLI